MIYTKIGYSASHKKVLQRLANKCEKLSREYTERRDPFCQCLDPRCFISTGLDWMHAIPRHREQFKYDPDNTLRMNHEHHLRIDCSPHKKELLDELMNDRIGVDVWNEMKRLAMLPFTPTEEFYLEQIKELETLLRGVIC